MKKRRVLSSFVFKALFLLILSINLVTTASATLVNGSSGTVNIIGNDSAHATGSFTVQVDYSVYDGKSSGDPLGLTSNPQIAFKLTHLGSGGESPALKFGRFVVFAPTGWAGQPTAFYLSTSAVGTGKAPSVMDIDPPPISPPGYPNEAEFYFQTGLGQADFGYTAPNNVSKLLVVTTTAARLPAHILLEVNGTDVAPQVSGEMYIDLIVPEPCSIAIFGGAFCLLRLMRHRRK